METLLTNTPMIDWITMTSWQITAWDELIHDELYKPQTIEGYKGHRDNKSGIWVGTGKQRDFQLNEMVAHRMLEVSGRNADREQQSVRLASPTDAKCTRVDIQITTEWPRADTFNVLRRWREKGRRGSSFESDTGMTVYLGAWGSERFVRIYQKTPTLCRFEMCYKRAYSVPLWERLDGLDEPARRMMMSNWLKYELLRISDPVLNGVFGDVLAGNPEKPPREARRPTTDTERWIKRVVYPALAKYANDHDNDPYLIDGLIAILKGDKNEPPTISENSD